MHKRYPILIKFSENEIRKYSVEFQTESKYYESFRKVLAKAHKRLALYCCCPEGKPEDKPLYVAYYADTDTYVIKPYPRTKERHSKDCIFRIGSTGFPDYATFKALAEKSQGDFFLSKDKGVLTIRTEIGVKKRTAPLKKSKTEQDKVKREIPKSYKSYGRKPTTSYTGILQKLWESSGLCEFNPSEIISDINVVSKKLLKASEKIILSKGIKLSSIMLVPNINNKELEEHNRKVLDFCKKAKIRPFVLGIIGKYDTKRELPWKTVPLKFFAGIPILKFGDELSNQLEKLHKTEISLWKNDPKVNLVLLCHCDMNTSNNSYTTLEVIKFGALIVSEAWIPVSSSFELKLERFLRWQKRRFAKPFTEGRFEVVPDFVLLDTESGFTPLEVFGMDTESYLERKREKIKYYREKFGNDWWAWNPLESAEIPRLPPKRKTQQKSLQSSPESETSTG